MAVVVASMEVTLWRWKSPGGMEVPEKKEGENEQVLSKQKGWGMEGGARG